MTKDYDSFLERMRSFDMDMSSPPEEEETGQNDEINHGEFHDIPISEIKHFGVKGMKWGVRRSLRDDGRIVGSKYATNDSTNKKSSKSNKDSKSNNDSKSKSSRENKKVDKKAAKEIAKADKKWSKGLSKSKMQKAMADADSRTKKQQQEAAKKLTKTENYRKAQAGDRQAAVQVSFDWTREYAKILNDDISKQSELKSPSGKKALKVQLVRNGNQPLMTPKIVDVDEEVKHSITHARDGDLVYTVEDELKHFGIKGMKWGVRRPIGSDGLILPNSKTGRSEKSKGKGKGQEKDPDHELAKQVRKTSPGRVASSFSEDEIKVATDRVRMENNVKRLAKQYSDPEGKQTAKNISKVDSKKLAEVNKKLQNLDNLQNQINQGKDASTILKKTFKEAAVDVTFEYAMNRGMQTPAQVAVSTLSKVAASSIKQYYGQKSVQNKALNVATQTYKQKK